MLKLACAVWIAVLMLVRPAAAQNMITLPSVPSVPLAQMRLGQNGQVYVPFGNQYIPIISTTGHVTNASALSLLANFSQNVIRDDVGALYIDTGANCANADGFWQIQPVTGHCWKTDISRGASLALWSPDGTGQTNTVPAWNAALSALNAAGGGTLSVPTPSVAYRIDATVSNPYPNVYIRGQDGTPTIAINFASGPGVVVGSTGAAAASILNSGAKNLRFTTLVTRTSGAALEVAGVFNGTVDAIQCGNQQNSGLAFAQCVDVDGSTVVHISNIMAFSEGTSGLSLGCNGGEAADITIDGNNNINYQHLAGLELCYTSGGLFSGIDTDQNQRNVWIHPGIGQAVSANFFTQSFLDVTFGSGVQIDDIGGGIVADNVFSPTVWQASSGAPPAAAGIAFKTSFTQTALSPGYAVGSSGLSFTGGISGNTLNVTAIAAGANLGVGQIVSGIGVADETRIDALGTGTGGVGTYTVTANVGTGTQTVVAGTAMNATGVVANAFLGHTFGNSGSGMAIYNADDTRISGEITNNCEGCSLPSQGDGVIIAANMRHVTIDARIGGRTDYGSTNNQGYAVFDNGGSFADFFNFRGDWSGNQLGDYANNSPLMGHKLVSVLGNTGPVVSQSLMTPATSSAACYQGQMEDDARYHYVCTSANHWERAALSTF